MPTKVKYIKRGHLKICDEESCEGNTNPKKGIIKCKTLKIDISHI
jgi:hypothetical protein